MKINDTIIKTPQDFNIKIEKIKRISKRTASGRMVAEDRGQKRTFVFSYSYLKESDFDTLRTLLSDTFVDFEYESETIETMTSDIDYKIYMKTSNGFVYTDVGFELIER